MKKKITIFLLMMFVSQMMTSQSFQKQQNRFIFINIGINGLIGGIGAIINKEKNQKFHEVLIKGFSQGCLGGSIQTIGKSFTYQISERQNLNYGWPARITNSIGSSITQNAANNDNFWEHLHLNLGIVRIDYSTKNKKIKARIFPSSIVGLLLASNQGKLNMKASIKSSALIFENDGFVSLAGSQSQGFGVVSSIAINTNLNQESYHDIIAHEIMHTLQYDNLVWMNPVFKKQNLKWKKESKLYETLNKYIYLDLNGFTLYAFYISQINKNWECRYFEREADFFSNKVVYPKCN